MIEKKPTCYVIAGPNGAGKTTFAMHYLPQVAACRNFVNADMIAQGLSPLNTHRVEAKAGRILLQRINELLVERSDFAFETTLSGRAYAHLFRRLHDAGFEIMLFYLWIPNAEFSAERVASRVANGGHNIPSDAISRRYMKSLCNLFNLYVPLSDRVLIFDNSCEKASLVANIQRESEKIIDNNIYKVIKRQIEEVNNE